MFTVHDIMATGKPMDLSEIKVVLVPLKISACNGITKKCQTDFITIMRLSSSYAGRRASHLDGMRNDYEVS